MHGDLERLIRLQRLDTAAEDARRAIAAIPERLGAVDARLEGARAGVAAARVRLEANQTARRALEKDLTVIQSRLSKFKDQLMEVKTNREYQALQKEIETAQHEVAELEGRILERMLEADDFTASLKTAEAALAAEEKACAAERQAIEAERRQTEEALDGIARQRRALVAEIPPAILSLFEQVSRLRKGIAVAEARDGLCSICHVRLRPQVYNDVRRNESIIQCENCQRILFYAPPQAAAGTSS